MERAGCCGLWPVACPGVPRGRAAGGAGDAWATSAQRSRASSGERVGKTAGEHRECTQRGRRQGPGGRGPWLWLKRDGGANGGERASRAMPPRRRSGRSHGVFREKVRGRCLRQCQCQRAAFARIELIFSAGRLWVPLARVLLSTGRPTAYFSEAGVAGAARSGTRARSAAVAGREALREDNSCTQTFLLEGGRGGTRSRGEGGEVRMDGCRQERPAGTMVVESLLRLCMRSAIG